ncbi:MAG: hypothetical protein ACRDYD_11240 [Acidimicrobiales bacterium]
MRRPAATSIVSLVCVAGAVAFVLWQLDPPLLLANTTTAGGDTGAHVLVARFLRDHLLPHWRVTGWSPDWYDGFPLLTFYFPLPSLLVVGANVLVPYNVAFKLVTAAGSLALPVAAWAFGRLGRLPRPVPECLAVATVPFLFDRSFTIDGGNLASTLAGEYDFSIALALALLFLGLMASGLRSGRHRALAAAVLAATALCHVVPAMLAAGGAVVLLLMGPGKRRLRWAVPVGVVAVALTAFWSLPFAWYLPYTTSMGWVKVTDYVHSLFPLELDWAVALAVVGAAASLLRRWPAGRLLVVLAAGSAAAFVLAPQGKLYNARLLPFWVLCVYLLAGLGVAELGLLFPAFYRLAERRRRARALVPDRLPDPGGGPAPDGRSPDGRSPDGAWSPGGGAGGGWSPGGGAGGAGSPGDGAGGGWAPADPARAPVALATQPLSAPARLAEMALIRKGRRRGAVMAGIVTPLLALAVTLGGEAIPLEGLPSWSPVAVRSTSFLPDWVRWNYSGYQGKSTWPEYHALMTTMAGIGERYGCGRAMWEYGPELNDLGTTMALMLLPYWTGGCVDSMEGLLFESSATTPYHFINQAELSTQPSEAMVGLPYGSLDVAQGVHHLQMLGVRYLMAFTPAVETQADADHQLSLIARSGPWPTTVGSKVVSRTWKIYLVRDSSTVVPLRNRPVVATGIPGSSKGWLKAAMAWYLDPPRQAVDMAQGGPPGWSRVAFQDGRAPATPVTPTPVTPTTVSHIVQGDDGSISFDVGRLGSPVLVKTSYFPEWQASGAAGPWRVAPNLMVVVPTSHRVVLRYGRSLVDYAGIAVTAAAVVALAALWWSERRRRPGGRRSPGGQGSPGRRRWPGWQGSPGRRRSPGGQGSPGG